MKISRRPFFFAFLAVIALVLLPFTPSEYRALNVFMAGLALFWSIALAIEELSTARDASDRAAAERDPTQER